MSFAIRVDFLVPYFMRALNLPLKAIESLWHCLEESYQKESLVCYQIGQLMKGFSETTVFQLRLQYNPFMLDILKPFGDGALYVYTSFHIQDPTAGCGDRVYYTNCNSHMSFMINYARVGSIGRESWFNSMLNHLTVLHMANTLSSPLIEGEWALEWHPRGFEFRKEDLKIALGFDNGGLDCLLWRTGMDSISGTSNRILYSFMMYSNESTLEREDTYIISKASFTYEIIDHAKEGWTLERFKNVSREAWLAFFLAQLPTNVANRKRDASPKRTQKNKDDSIYRCK